MPKSYLKPLPVLFPVLLAALTIVALFPSLAGPVAPSYAQNAQATPTVASISAIVRAGGATLLDAAGSQIALASAGERVEASARSADGKWLAVRNSAGATGWLARDAVLIFNGEALPTQNVTIRPAQPTPTPAPAFAAATVPTTTVGVTAAPTVTMESAASITATVAITIAVDRLNVRVGPGTAYAVIAKAHAGEAWLAVARNAAGDWLQVTGGDGAGWLATAFVTTDGDLDALPIAESAAAPAARADAQEVAQAAPVASQAVVHTAASGLRGKLVLQVAAGGAIYVYDLANGALRQLTTGFDPTLSPDGAQVAFTRSGGDQGLYVINVDGSGERLVFGERNALSMPKWSPDGNSLLFVRGDSRRKCKDYSERRGRYQCLQDQSGDGDLPYIFETRPRLARVDLNGENYLDIASLDTASAPDWGRAGIVYASDGGIQITSDNGKDENRLVYFNVQQQYYQDPDWQPRPDGAPGRIVLQQRRGSHWEIFAVNPDGSDYVALTRPTTVLVDALPSNVAPAWSPDGEHIVFLSNRTPDNAAGAWGVWVMRPDGSDQRRLPIDLPFTYTYVEEQMIDWAP